MEMKRYLQNWPEIGIAELRPAKDGYSIIALLREPLQLIDILQGFPEVSHIDEDKEQAGTAPAEGLLRKVEVTLAGK